MALQVLEKNLAQLDEGTLLVDTAELMQLLHSTRYTALKLADMAGARVNVGKKPMFNIQRIKNYLNNLPE